VLQAITPINSTQNRYEWKERNPIDYYLISASVANYIDYSFYAHFTGSADSVLIQNYLYDSAALLANKSVIDSTALIIDYFSTLYGRYPFWKEKYGHCLVPANGGMENQTMTSIGGFYNNNYGIIYNSTPIVAHELAHQWFGDNVTCATWRDIFMNESFATYSEYLFAAYFDGPVAAQQFIMYAQNFAIQYPVGTVYVADTTSEDSIFNQPLTYYKGAAVLHMLRFVENNDSIYFQAYKSYQQQYAGGTATINDFKNVAAQVFNKNLDTFFNQWIYEEGYPIYYIFWDQVENQIYLKIIQTTSTPASVVLFAMPIEIKFQSSQGDTTVRVYNNQDTSFYTFSWNHTVNGLTFDPNHWLVCKGYIQILPDTTLSISQPLCSMPVTIYPNPTNDKWQIDNLENKNTLRLTDATGRTLWEKAITSTSYSVPAANLASGIYILYITNPTGKAMSYKLVKQ